MEEEEHLAAVAAAAGTCRAESKSSPHHQEVGEGIGGHYYWSSEELLFQELVTQLLLSSSIKQQQQLQGNNHSPPPPRLGSGELVQLRKLFQETTRTTRLFKLLDVQVQEVMDLEAEMRELKLQGTTTEGRGGEGGGGHTTTQTKAWNGSLMMMMRYSEDEEEEVTAVEDDVVVGGAKDLETKMMQLGDMELEQQHGDDTRLEEAAAAESQKQQQQQHNSGKRRTCFGVAISKFDVKKRYEIVKISRFYSHILQRATINDGTENLEGVGSSLRKTRRKLICFPKGSVMDDQFPVLQKNAVIEEENQLSQQALGGGSDLIRLQTFI